MTRIWDYAEKIRAMFAKAKARADVDAFSSVTRNPDHTVDGEIRFIVGRRNPRELMIDIEGWLPRLPEKIWISTGARYAPTSEFREALTKEERYLMLQGMITIGNYSRRGQIKVRKARGTKRGTVAAKPYSFVSARTITDSVIAATHRKPLELFVRLTYTPNDKQPERRGRPLETKKERRQKREKRKKRGKIRGKQKTKKKGTRRAKRNTKRAKHK